MTKSDSDPNPGELDIFDDVVIYACALFEVLGRAEAGADRPTMIATRRVLDRLFGALARASNVSEESIAAWHEPPSADDITTAAALRRRYEIAKGSM